jgi:hypothetical protein
MTHGGAGIVARAGRVASALTPVGAAAQSSNVRQVSALGRACVLGQLCTAEPAALDRPPTAGAHNSFLRAARSGATPHDDAT